LGKTIKGNILNNERKVLVVKNPELLDINPKTWLRPYQKTNVWYMIRARQA
jgi:hypothetical protein